MSWSWAGELNSGCGGGSGHGSRCRGVCVARDSGGGSVRGRVSDSARGGEKGSDQVGKCIGKNHHRSDVGLFGTRCP